mmetsp:Transcript_88763/g.271824  ORF Transcript_88763/g.271824 Transcript_88763/m.271824 type:complete len:241 (-) Transcript_88763:841-1563(-)
MPSLLQRVQLHRHRYLPERRPCGVGEAHDGPRALALLCFRRRLAGAPRPCQRPRPPASRAGLRGTGPPHGRGARRGQRRRVRAVPDERGALLRPQQAGHRADVGVFPRGGFGEGVWSDQRLRVPVPPGRVLAPRRRPGPRGPAGRGRRRRGGAVGLAREGRRPPARAVEGGHRRRRQHPGGRRGRPGHAEQGLRRAGAGAGDAAVHRDPRAARPRPGVSGRPGPRRERGPLRHAVLADAD